jgi:hypothetical protein
MWTSSRGSTPDIIAITQRLLEQPLAWFPDSWHFVAERSWLLRTATARRAHKEIP